MGEFWEKHRQVILLVSLLVVAFVTVHFPFSKGNLDKDTMPVSITYDNYYHPVVAKGIFDREDARTYPPHRAMGVQNSIIVDPPLHFLVPATFAKLTTLPFYQVHFFISVFYLLWTSVLVFVLVRKYFSPLVALVTLAFALLPTSAAWFFPLYIGFTPTFEAFFFVPFILFLLFFMFEHQSVVAAVLLGAGLAAQFLTHGPFEAGYMLVFVTIVMAWSWWKSRTPALIKNWLIAMVTAGMLSFSQYRLLRLTRITQENIFETLLAGHPVPAYFPRPELGWVMWVLISIGALVLVSRLIGKKLSQPQLIITTLITFFVAFGFSYNFGVDGSRAFRALYNAYPFFALLPAVGLVAAWNAVKQRVPAPWGKWFDVAVIVVLIWFAAPPVFKALEGIAAGGQATPERWQALQWIRHNTPADARVFYLYGFEHEFGMLGERIPYKGDLGLGYTQRNVLELCNGRFPANFSGQWGSSMGVKVEDNQMFTPMREGLFATGWALITRPGTTIPIPKAEDEILLSGVDYVVFQEHGTQADPCMAFFLNQSLERGARVAWKNNLFTILEVTA